MKIMRSNYDKKHRCPNWSGPAFKGGKGDCPGGSLSPQMYPADGRNTHPEWKFYVCYQCGTIVLPNVLRNLDPSWWKFKAEWAIRKLKDPVWREYAYERKYLWHILDKKDDFLDRFEEWKYEREMHKFDKLD